jgi:hypothetical protein
MLTKTLDPDTRREIEEAALAANERSAKRRGPYEAAIIANATWHILTVAPNCDRIAAGHLIGRRFGIYLPQIKDRVPARASRCCPDISWCSCGVLPITRSVFSTARV